MQAQILIAHAEPRARGALASQLDADGYSVLQTNTAQNTLQLLGREPVSLILLGTLDGAAAAPRLLRELRSGRIALAVAPNVAVVTFGPADAVSQLRAYEAGSDHHLAADTSYVLLRAIIAAVIRRATLTSTRRLLHVGPLEIDTAAREVRVDGTTIPMPKREFELLRTLASEPTRVFTKQELLGELWGYVDAASTRTVESHACRLRRRLAEHGQRMVLAKWGVGWQLIGS